MIRKGSVFQLPLVLNLSFLAVINALVLRLEFLQSSGFGEYSAFLAWVERVTGGTDTDSDLFEGWACYESIAAGAGYFALLIFRVNVFLHYEYSS